MLFLAVSRDWDRPLVGGQGSLAVIDDHVRGQAPHVVVVADQPLQSLVVLVDIKVEAHVDQGGEEGGDEPVVPLGGSDGRVGDDVDVGDALVVADGPPDGGHPVDGGAAGSDIGDEVGLGDGVHGWVPFGWVGLFSIELLSQECVMPTRFSSEQTIDRE